MEYRSDPRPLATAFSKRSGRIPVDTPGALGYVFLLNWYFAKSFRTAIPPRGWIAFFALISYNEAHRRNVAP